MRSHLNTLLFWGTFSSVTSQNAVLDCGTMKTDEPVTAPVLSVTVTQTETERHVTLHCISVNGSLPINYTFFEKNVTISPAISKNRREPAEFNFTRKNSGEEEEYRCEARNSLPSHTKYSWLVTVTSTGGGGCPFCLQLLLPGLLLMLTVTVLILAFWILPKYKARKAMRHNVPKDRGEVGIYANISNDPADEASVPDVESRQCVSTAQDGAGDAQEIHYATPMFWEVAPIEQEACNDYKPGCVYSELVI
uniref:Mast cell immunoglobulin like receptor 1 n=1 Tax=Propithecus coquereli TaxID=379532 RepID=A0A2K6EWT4_PROCO